MHFLESSLLLAAMWIAVEAQRCNSVEAYFIADGRDYRGSVNVTATGLPCVPWSMQPDIQVPNPSLGLMPNDNSCRNPFGQSAPFCFTNNPVAPYQLCNVGPVCPFAQPQPSLTFSPAATSVAMGSFVSIACFPQPCQVYYTVDGSTPKVGISQFYEHSIVMTKSVTLSAIGVLLSGAVLTAAQYFTVFPPAPVPTTFFPDPTAIYYTPVLVSLRSVPPGVQVLIFQNGQATGTAYSGPFWLAASTSLVAVINQSQTVVSAYTIVCPSPAPPNIFPAGGGSYIGGVRVLVYRPTTAVLLEASINGSAWLASADPSISITTVGLTTLSVRATFLGGLVSSNVTSNYTVFPALVPTCVPAGNAVYSSAINVTCTNPTGKLLQLTVNGLLLPQSFWVLNLPGNYSIAASYTDDGGVTRATALTYVISPRPLPAPSISPCGGSFLGPLTVSILVGQVPALQWSLQTNLVNGSGLVYSLTSSAVVTAKLVSFDPMFLDSATVTCALAVSSDASGTATTPPIRILNPTSDMLTSIGNCLLLAAPQMYVRISPPIGPYVLVSIANVSDVLAARYDTWLSQCVAATQIARRTYSLATGYAAVDGPVTVGSAVRVQVFGANLQNVSFVVVRSEYSCDDVGLRLTNCSAGMLCTVSPVYVGVYTICANCGDGFYKLSAQQPIVVAQGRAPVPPAVAPCGGPVPGPTTVTIGAAALVVFSLNGSMWQPAPSSMVVVPPSTLVVRSQPAGLQTVCVFFVATLPARFTAYSTAFVTPAGLRLSFVGSASLDTDTIVQIQQSPACTDIQPLFWSYVTFNGTGWYSDSIMLLPMPSSDTQQLSVCVGGFPLASNGVVVSRLALSTTPCPASPTGCFNGLPTCPDGNGALALCSTGGAPPSPSSSGVSLKLVLVLIYAAAVGIIISMWRTADHQDIPGPQPHHQHRFHASYYHDEK